MGSNFVHDLLGLLDILKPLVDVMLQMQSLDCPVWKLKEIRQTLLKRLEQAGNYGYKNRDFSILSSSFINTLESRLVVHLR